MRPQQPMKQVRTAVELLLYFENVIFDNEQAFIQQFCEDPSTVMDLLSVYFAAERIKFYYINIDYATITDEISFTEFESWLKTIVPDFL